MGITVGELTGARVGLSVVGKGAALGTVVGLLVKTLKKSSVVGTLE